MTKFSEQMKKYRHDKGMTQQELADLLGVSNKTISRWESDGGYPDVTMLVPLARALGVTVDDLLDEEKPVRTLTRTDWQSLLSFAFALGGGVLFYLFDLFMPAALCYLAYLGCMAYGVYLQKYYAYQSRWFFLSNAVMDLAVSYSLFCGALSGLLSWVMSAGLTMTTENYKDLGIRLFFWVIQHQSLLYLFALLLAVIVAVLTQRFVLRWSGGTADGKSVPDFEYRLSLGRPSSARKFLLPLLPAAQLIFWLAYGDGTGLSAELVQRQETIFGALLALSAVACVLAFWKKGVRRWGVCGLALTLLGAATRLSWTEKKLLNVRNGLIFAYREVSGDNMLPFHVCQPALLAVLAVLTVLALLLCLVRVEKREKPPQPEETEENEE